MVLPGSHQILPKPDLFNGAVKLTGKITRKGDWFRCLMKERPVGRRNLLLRGNYCVVQIFQEEGAEMPQFP